VLPIIRRYTNIQITLSYAYSFPFIGKLSTKGYSAIQWVNAVKVMHSLLWLHTTDDLDKLLELICPFFRSQYRHVDLSIG